MNVVLNNAFVTTLFRTAVRSQTNYCHLSSVFSCVPKPASVVTACHRPIRSAMVHSSSALDDGMISVRDDDKAVQDKPRELSFVSRLNCTTGKMEWVELPEDYDFHQEIARSAYADMLHDHDRNMRYFDALKYEIAKLKAENKPAHVLDIGTGTGLLSMMAVVAGADSVFACDAFTPMLECARKVVRRNGFEHKIKLIPKRSTELVVGVDLPHRCNLLVTEVFDTELIGEGAISTFNHAHRELLTDPAVVIPSTSTVYAQVVSSAEVEKWNSLPPVLNLPAGMQINFSPEISSCPGVPSVQDLQLDAIHPSEFTALSPPLPIFQFDFASSTPIPSDRSSKIEFRSEASGRANAVFLWWDLGMDTSGSNVLSCQPAYVKDGAASWFESCDVQEAAWRDHWMHSVYYIPRAEVLEESQAVTLHSAHDEFSFWFDVSKDATVELPSCHPVCHCRAHTILSRSQIYMMNDVERYGAFIECFRKQIVKGETSCVCISDCSVLPVILAKLGARNVIVVESSGDSERVCRDIVGANGGEVKGSVQFVRADELDKLPALLNGSKVDLVVGDPYFQVAVYPWNHLMFWYLLKSLDQSVLSQNVRLAPRKMVVRGMACKFTHLWKINAPVNVAAGEFNLVDFDELISHSSSISDCAVDAQPLWEYESISTSSPATLLELNLSESLSKHESDGELKLDLPGTNGIALWIDWELDDSSRSVVTTGPRQSPSTGSPVVWQRFSKQGVYFLRTDREKIQFKVQFNSSTADFLFNFS